MSRLHSRVQKIEKHRGESSTVIAIVNKIRRASNEQLDDMLQNGQFQSMVDRLNDQELDRLIERFEEMLTQPKSSRGSRVCTRV